MTKCFQLIHCIGLLLLVQLNLFKLNIFRTNLCVHIIHVFGLYRLNLLKFLHWDFTYSLVYTEFWLNQDSVWTDFKVHLLYLSFSMEVQKSMIMDNCHAVLITF